MNDRRVRIYVGVMCLAAAAGAMLTDWSSLARLPQDALVGLAGLTVIALLSESLAIRLSVGSSAGSASITFLPLLASVQLFGQAAGLVLITTTMLFGEFVVRRKGALRGTFNVAQVIFSTAVSGWVFLFLHGVPLEGPSAGSVEITSQLWPFVSFGLVFLAINHASVSLAITLSQGMPFRRVWQLALSHSGASLNDLLISPIALAVAFLYVQFGITGILVVLMPMLFIRYSYVTTSKLRDANTDLLEVLVKAIETRDPYTSGHSRRVSVLARLIADELGLARTLADRIETAALLHDIGKIEAVYTDILRKPGALTPEERTVIESHVTKGEELLRNLSSVPDPVIKAVRHHHEREDGCGYPDGLLGDEIPIGAKIIVACDAVDAMLSDRPYRKALSIDIVKQQLREHAGRQFDHRVIRALMTSNILADYDSIMRSSRSVPITERGGGDVRAGKQPRRRRQRGLVAVPR
jgi:putative nucleotidyltransferase with HDIG domain